MFPKMVGQVQHYVLHVNGAFHCASSYDPARHATYGVLCLVLTSVREEMSPTHAISMTFSRPKAIRGPAAVDQS